MIAALKPGMRECLKPGVDATIGLDGCKPASRVESRSRLPRAVAEGLREVDSPAGRNAIVVFRGPRDKPTSPLRITPSHNSFVTNDRPGLAWPMIEGVSSYRVSMTFDGSGREAWVAETKVPRLPYPADRPALRRGRTFAWFVAIPRGRFWSEDHSHLPPPRKSRG